MHRGCDLPLCCTMYHQPCEMSPDRNSNVLPAPLGMAHTQQDTWCWIMEAREMQSPQGPHKFLLICLAWGAFRSGLPGAVVQSVQLCVKPVSWIRVSDPCSCPPTGLCFPWHKQRELNGLQHSISLRTKKVNAGNALFWNICNWQFLPSISRPVKSLYINCVVISVICLMSPCLAVWETVSKCKNTTFFSWGSGVWLHQDSLISLYYFTLAFSNHSGWWT